MATFFIRNPRILVLALVLMGISGGAAFWTLPRMEDPLLTPRAATLTTILPGADAERVESLVTDKLEQSLREVAEIKELNSTSRAGVSFIAIELKDEVDATQAHQIWSQIRDKADDARLEMPAEASKPEFKRLEIKAYGLIVGLRWESNEATRYGVLHRWMQQLKDRIDAIPGTEKSDAFGDPKEEIVVTIDPESATAMNLNADSISKMIFASDSKSSAGQLRGVADDVLLGVSGELDSITQLSHLPIRLGEFGNVVELADIATIEKTIRTPVDSKVLLKDQPAIALGVFVQPSVRLDWWMSRVVPVLDQFEAELPPGIALERVFNQSDFVNSRMRSLLQNLLYGAGAIFLVILIVMGWRSAWVISLALPLGSLLVLFIMYAAGIPIHQISITGLIIAMGLMIDNAIVVVDEVDKFLQKGCPAVEAVRHSVSFLSVPLLGATLTTVFSFGPIALMPGPSGEFVGSIAIVAIIAVATSYLLGLTVIASVAGLVLKKKLTTASVTEPVCQRNWLVRAYLFLSGGDFWPPVAIAISGGVFGATGLAILFVPSMYMLLFRNMNRSENHSVAQVVTPN